MKWASRVSRSRQSAQDVKDLNPAFRWFVYNSVTDNYVNGGGAHEQDMIETIAARHGWDPDIAYLHYYEDTRIWNGSDTLFIPGWTGGSATSIEQARLPFYTSYYLTNPRIATHFATPQAQQLQKEVILGLTVDATFEGTDLHPDGVFFDNSGSDGRKVGTLVSGGRVLETPGSAIVAGTTAFDTWYWQSNLRPFLTAFKDTLETSESWSGDGQRKYSMINVASYWTDEYITLDAADIIFLEFQYYPVRSTGANAIWAVWQRDNLAAAAGITLFYSPAMSTTSPYGGTIPFGESLLGGLAWYLTTRTDESLLFIQATGNPNVAGWDTLTWRGCIDVADHAAWASDERSLQLHRRHRSDREAVPRMGQRLRERAGAGEEPGPVERGHRTGDGGARSRFRARCRPSPRRARSARRPPRSCCAMERPRSSSAFPARHRPSLRWPIS